MIKATAIIQARLGSSRLPGKVLMDVSGRPLLSYMIERVRMAKTIDQVVIATTTSPGDDPIAAFCEKNAVPCFRGDQDDVLDRYFQAARQAEATVIVRLTSDCPVLDPAILDRVVGAYTAGEFDYVANTAPPVGTYPDGMDVEVFSFTALEKAWHEATRPSEREHVTFQFWQNPGVYRTFRVDLPESLSHVRLTVDYPVDFQVVSAIIAALSPRNPAFSLQDILEFLDGRPDLRALNNNIGWGQGWKPALARDRQQAQEK